MQTPKSPIVRKSYWLFFCILCSQFENNWLRTNSFCKWHTNGKNLVNKLQWCLYFKLHSMYTQSHSILLQIFYYLTICKCYFLFLALQGIFVFDQAFQPVMSEKKNGINASSFISVFGLYYIRYGSFPIL